MEIDSDGVGIQPHQAGAKPGHNVVETFDLFLYYFRGEAQGDLGVFGSGNALHLGSTDQADVGKEMEKRKEEEYLKATEALRAMGEEHKKALNDLDILIREESGGNE